MSGIGINLREVPDENGDVKVKVLGLVLDGPAQSAGVRQVFLYQTCSYRCNIMSVSISPFPLWLFNKLT